MIADSDRKKAKDFKLFSSFDRDLRIARYKPDRCQENIVDIINDQLDGMDEQIRKTIGGKSSPSIIITGVPRSGTTLISQLLPARYDLGYVSNLMARFYGSPLTGAWLQQQLLRKNIHLQRDFHNHHGVTESIEEPHEFGYFWSRYLNFDSDCHEPKNDKDLGRIDFLGLNRVLTDLSLIFMRPAVYKCAIAPFVINSFMLHTDTFVVHITRDRISTIESILRVREQRLGDETKWWSIRPFGWEKMGDKPPLEQVGWQYDRVFNAVHKGCEGFKHRVYEITLEELVKAPEKALENLMLKFVQYSGISIPKVGLPIEPFQGKRHQHEI